MPTALVNDYLHLFVLTEMYCQSNLRIVNHNASNAMTYRH